ncbi:MAG: DUF1249 domain-containing protein [Gammaproteobacteria bacterium]|nr:MAG: DUF1249 domain-containing protein [Gammaproteobacteria bacterium]
MIFNRFNNTLSEIEPRSFASLMELYEDSYIKLRRLIPDIETIDIGLVSVAQGSVPLMLKILSRHKFTTTIFLTHRFECDNASYDDPGLVVNIFHDARMAEVSVDEVIDKFGVELKCRQRTDLELDKRWELNKFLNKWLQYCLHEGHSFKFRPDLEEQAS